MEKLRNGRWKHQMATVEEINAAVKELKGKMFHYGWENRKIHPYGYPVSVEDFLDRLDDLGSYHGASLELGIEELNGFIEIANSWEAQELEPKVTIKLQNGKVKTCPKSIADSYLECGFATLV